MNRRERSGTSTEVLTTIFIVALPGRETVTIHDSLMTEHTVRPVAVESPVVIVPSTVFVFFVILVDVGVEELLEALGREVRGVVAVGLAAVDVDGLVVGELGAALASLEAGCEQPHGTLQVLQQIHNDVVVETCQWELMRTSDEVPLLKYLTHPAIRDRRSARWVRAARGP